MVAVDLRVGSQTFGQHVAVELSGENKRQLLIPRGFAHGFSVLSDEAVFSYKCDNFYMPANEGSVLFSDPELAIDWQIPQGDILLSDKDKKSPGFQEYCRNPVFFCSEERK